MPDIREPIGIFDSGLGSYSVVRRVRRRFPQADIVYLADRQHFPYGKKTPRDLENIVEATIAFLWRSHGCWRILVASNTPSLLCLRNLRRRFPKLQLFGVLPPIRPAERLSRTGAIAVLAPTSAAKSGALANYIRRQKRFTSTRIYVLDASCLVEVVESGLLWSDPAAAAAKVRLCLSALRRTWPAVDTVTLSSTHLSWLSEAIRTAARDLTIVDPADEVVKNLPDLAYGGSTTLALVTECPGYPFAPFAWRLRGMDANLRIENIGQLPAVEP